VHWIDPTGFSGCHRMPRSSAPSSGALLVPTPLRNSALASATVLCSLAAAGMPSTHGTSGYSGPDALAGSAAAGPAGMLPGYAGDRTGVGASYGYALPATGSPFDGALETHRHVAWAVVKGELSLHSVLPIFEAAAILA
jgi:hypothetical protein